MTDLRKLPRPGNRVIISMFRNFSGFHYPIAVRYIKYTKYFLSEYHHHDFPQVWYCVSGTYTHAVGDNDFICGPGSVIITPPGVFHAYEVSGDEPVELICLEGTFFFFNEMQGSGKTNTIANMFCPQFGEELGFSPPCFIELPDDEKVRADELLLSLCKNDYKRNLPNVGSIRKK